MESVFCTSSYLSNTPQQGFLTPPYPQHSTADSQQCASDNTRSRSLFSPKLVQHLQTPQSYFHLGVYVFPTPCRVLLSVGREMIHVCPGGGCASSPSSSSSAGAAAAVAVHEPSWTKLIGHMLPRQSVCLASERAKRASLREAPLTRGFSVNIWFTDLLIKPFFFFVFFFTRHLLCLLRGKMSGRRAGEAVNL